MSIKLGDNIEMTGPVPNDARYLNVNVPWTSISAVNTALLGGAGGVRYKGLTVNINGSEYWYKDGIADIDLIEKTTGGGGGSGLLNWTGSTANAIGTYISVSGICAQQNLTFSGSTLSVAGAGVAIKMTDSDSPNLTGGLVSEVGGQLIDYGMNYNQLGDRNAAYAGGFFRIDLRPTQTNEFFNIKYVPSGSTEQTIFSVSTGGTTTITGTLTAPIISATTCFVGSGVNVTGCVTLSDVSTALIINNTSTWSYLRYQYNGATSWDTAVYQGGDYEIRTAGASTVWRIDSNGNTAQAGSLDA